MKASAAKHNTGLSAGGAARLWALVLLLLAVFFGSFFLGRYGISPLQLLAMLAEGLQRALTAVVNWAGRPFDFSVERLFAGPVIWTPVMETIVLNIRLPRILMACLVGCCLSTAGACYQGVFQNPMAAPDLLGASTGACFGAALAILYGASSAMITLSAFGFSLLTVLLVFVIGQRAPGQKTVTLILAGIMVSSLFSAGTSYIKLVADPGSKLPEITYWLMGSLSGTRGYEIAFALLPMALGLLPLLCLRWRLNLLTLGEEEARALGVNTALLRLIVVVCSTLITAASVAVSGLIGWVGLVIPHLCRRYIGNDYRRLLPATMLFGAAFLLVVDNISRNLLAVEIPIGILTAFIGAPFFIYLMSQKGGGA